MNPTPLLFRALVVVLPALGLASLVLAYSMVDDALAFAHEAAHPYVVNEGFQVREEVWGGDLGEGQQKGISIQLFRGNEYWFWLGTAEEGSLVQVHVYDSDGNLAEDESWQRGRFAACRISPRATGTHYVLVKVAKAQVERTHWGLVYGYR